MGDAPGNNVMLSAHKSINEKMYKKIRLFK